MPLNPKSLSLSAHPAAAPTLAQPGALSGGGQALTLGSLGTNSGPLPGTALHVSLRAAVHSYHCPWLSTSGWGAGWGGWGHHSPLGSLCALDVGQRLCHVLTPRSTCTLSGLRVCSPRCPWEHSSPMAPEVPLGAARRMGESRCWEPSAFFLPLALPAVLCSCVQCRWSHSDPAGLAKLIPLSEGEM